jgi:hypothetical protein
MKRINKLPKGIGLRISKNNGSVIDIVDPYLKNVKWKNISVNSNKFKKLPSWKRLFLLSLEFLNSAKLICNDAGKLKKRIRWTQGSISYFNLHMATELFIKSCLIKSGNKIKHHHVIADLYKLYQEIFKDDNYYFPNPWAISGYEINKIIGKEVFTGIDLNTDQLYRYFEDKDGNPPKGTHVFSPGYQLNYINDLEQRWLIIINNIKEKK